MRGTLAHLRHRSGRRREFAGIQRLDRIDHDDRGLLLPDRRDDAFERDLRQQSHLRGVDAQTPGAQRHLCRRLLAADVEHACIGRQRCERLQQQRRLADAGIAADQHDAAFDQAAAEDAIELLDAATQPRDLARLHLAQRLHRRGGRERSVAVPARVFDARLRQRVPRAAVRTLALPLQAGTAALGTDELGSRLRHISRRSQRARAARPRTSIRTPRCRNAWRRRRSEPDRPTTRPGCRRGHLAPQSDRR